MSRNEEELTKTQEYTPTSTPGNTLREVRKERGLSLEVVSEATKISINNIRAIEEEAYEKLPADTFVRGLVTLYGNFLTLDGSKIAAEFLVGRENNTTSGTKRIRAKKHIHSSSLAPKKLAEPAHISSATIALILLMVIILSFTGFCLYTSWNPLAFLSRQTESIQTSMQGIFSNDHQQEEHIPE